ncbi:MAG: SDR family NAD(P)-dependent oxidoreductase, partial [Aigarchaeota archaeon]|nr:SDR family NAD(P)-dependent oxidoreductase [Aigarchaeota archaeon]
MVRRGRGEGKIAIVVGASRGIGEGIVRDFAKEGARVVLVCSRTIDRALKIAEEINQKYGPGRAAPIQADVTKEEDVIRMIDETVNVFGG